MSNNYLLQLANMLQCRYPQCTGSSSRCPEVWLVLILSIQHYWYSTSVGYSHCLEQVIFCLYQHNIFTSFIQGGNAFLSKIRGNKTYVTESDRRSRHSIHHIYDQNIKLVVIPSENLIKSGWSQGLSLHLPRNLMHYLPPWRNSK